MLPEDSANYLPLPFGFLLSSGKEQPLRAGGMVMFQEAGAAVLVNCSWEGGVVILLALWALATPQAQV